MKNYIKIYLKRGDFSGAGGNGQLRNTLVKSLSLRILSGQVALKKREDLK